MKLVRIGDTTINMDRVNHIDDNGDHISITFDNSVEFPEGSIQVNDTAEVAVLRRWIALNAEDMSGFEEGSTGAPLGDPPPYISTR